MGYRITAEEIQDLEQALVRYHSRHESESVETCTNWVCREVIEGVAWLKCQYESDAQKT